MPNLSSMQNKPFKDLPSDMCFYNLCPSELIESAIHNNEGVLSNSGAFVVNTAPFTGRSPNDKYFVENEDPDLWLATGTQLISVDVFNKIKNQIFEYYKDKKAYVRDVVVGKDVRYSQQLRVITDLSWQNLVSSNLFITKGEETQFSDPDLTVIAVSGFAASPELDGLRSPAFVMMDFEQRLVLIGTTRYAGEIKKSVFTFMNYLLPKIGVLPLHCSANKGKRGDVTLFFGLSGTGKTTLSSDPERSLIGDDEHGWGDEGIFNFEGGCYAKTIRINPALEPLVWSAINHFGCLIENVPLSPDRLPDFNSAAITENTRAAYPLNFIPNFEPTGMGKHPEHIFFLTADAFGVLPPLARLNPDQALYYFLSGYTSKLAGTERGLSEKPEATFSTCFGAPFLPLKPSIYADLLLQKLTKHHTKVWLLNTGWTGGGFGTGKRIPLPITRAIIKSVLSGKLNDEPTHVHPIFRLEIPNYIEEVSRQILDPELSWNSRDEYFVEAENLARKFIDNFRIYRDTVSETVSHSGPNLIN